MAPKADDEARGRDSRRQRERARLERVDEWLLVFASENLGVFRKWEEEIMV